MKSCGVAFGDGLKFPLFPSVRTGDFPPRGKQGSCLPLRGNCGFALPVADEAKPEFPQRSKNASKRMCAAFFGHRKAEVSAAVSRKAADGRGSFLHFFISSFLSRSLNFIIKTNLQEDYYHGRQHQRTELPHSSGLHPPRDQLPHRPGRRVQASEGRRRGAQMAERQAGRAAV